MIDNKPTNTKSLFVSKGGFGGGDGWKAEEVQHGAGRRPKHQVLDHDYW